MFHNELSMGLQGFVGISFFIISMALLAATAFFIMERNDMQGHWRTSISIAALVTGIAFVHYLYMRDLWPESASSLSAIRYIGGTSLTTVRYIDWFITVPLQIIEFYVILRAVGYQNIWLFWRLLIASILMLIFGFIGEGFHFQVLPMLLLGTIAWLYIIYELFFGEVHKSMEQANNPASTLAISGLKWIVSIGWSIYPIGYFLGMMGTQSTGILYLNLTYNLADFVNKIAFGLVIWAAARKACQLNIKTEQ